MLTLSTAQHAVDARQPKARSTVLAGKLDFRTPSLGPKRFRSAHITHSVHSIERVASTLLSAVGAWHDSAANAAARAGVQLTMLMKLCSIERVRVYSSTTHLCLQYSLIRFCKPHEATGE